MTRDEAMKKLAEVVHVQGGNISERSIGMSLDGYVALGMLKLDEPDMDEGHGKVFKIRKFMRNFHLESYSPGELEGALAMAGLKIVEE